MAKDLRNLFETERKETQAHLAQGHEARFLKRLDAQFPQQTKNRFSSVWRVAASVVLLLGLGFVAFQFFNPATQKANVIVNNEVGQKRDTMKTLGDVSPDFKKIEDYYLANISLELSKVKQTPHNKELFDGYVLRLAELNKEYKRLSGELSKNGPNELMVSALIDNLKLRLNLLYRLKSQLKTLNASEDAASAKTKS